MRKGIARTNRKKKSSFYVEKKGYGAQKRLPVALLIDVSSSMRGTEKLINHCIKSFIEKLKTDMKGQVDFLLIFFNGDTVIKIKFQALDNIDKIEKFFISSEDIYGFTDTGRAIYTAIDCLIEKKEEYKKSGTLYHQPKIFLVSDGRVSAYVGAEKSLQGQLEEKYDHAAEKVREMANADKLAFAAAAIQRKGGVSANIKELEKVTDYVISVSDQKEMKLAKIEQFFEFMVQTITQQETPLGEVFHQFLGRE